MADYVFKIKKGEIEIEIASDDPKFIEDELSKWREDILKLQNQMQSQIYEHYLLKEKFNNPDLL